MVGLAATPVHRITAVTDFLHDAGFDITQRQGWLFLLISPLLLVAGCLLRGM